jgi:hypothetical protein
MTDERPATDDPATTAETADDIATGEAAEGDRDAVGLEADAPDDVTPRADADEPPADEVDPGARETTGSGTPGVPPPGRDERRSPDGLPPTTTTGDPAKDFRGPPVTEEARDGIDEEVLDEPGYGDLGHAEDHRILRRD